MKRKILFRATAVYGKFKNTFVYGYYLMSDNLHYINCIESNEDILIFPKTLSQLTGLKDSDNKDVYENDIIAVNGGYEKLIRWKNKGFGFCLVNIDDLVDESWKDIEQTPSDVWWNDFKRETKVIGNVFENADLLKKSN